MAGGKATAVAVEVHAGGDDRSDAMAVNVTLAANDDADVLADRLDESELGAGGGGEDVVASTIRAVVGSSGAIAFPAGVVRDDDDAQSQNVGPAVAYSNDREAATTTEDANANLSKNAEEEEGDEVRDQEAPELESISESIIEEPTLLGEEAGDEARVSTSMESLLSCNYAKGHGQEFLGWMQDKYPGVLPMQLERATSGSRHDIAVEGAAAVYWNQRDYMDILRHQTSSVAYEESYDLPQ